MTYQEKSNSIDSISRYYKYDENEIEEQRKAKLWEKDPKYYQECKISTVAAMKMLKHAITGVEKGRQALGVPIEIMGLMIGKTVNDTIIILDSCPLPVEGSETRVVADDAQTHMIELLESLNIKRHESFIGWYHSHPFDYAPHSHCHLSAIDVQTQTVWQNVSPQWCAIVIDPLRSLINNIIELACFRVFPVNYQLPADLKNLLCPDGNKTDDSKFKIERWGAIADRYYQLKLSYFSSAKSQSLLLKLTKPHLWKKVLTDRVTVISSNKSTEYESNFISNFEKSLSQFENFDLRDLPTFKSSFKSSLSQSKYFATPFNEIDNNDESSSSLTARHQSSQRYSAKTQFAETQLTILQNNSTEFKKITNSLQKDVLENCKCTLSNLARESILNWLIQKQRSTPNVSQ